MKPNSEQKPNNAQQPALPKASVRRRHSYRRKQMLNWVRTAKPEKWLDFHYIRWMNKVGADNMLDSVYKASEDQLDELYVLREELRLGI